MYALLQTAFLLFTLFLSVSAADGTFRSVLSAVLLMALYFPAVNTFSTPHWLLRARWSVLLSATGAALLGITQFTVAAVLLFQGAGGATMAELGSAVRAGFSDNGAFAYFMVLALPFAFHAFLRAKKSYRLPAGFACVAIVVASALCWVQSAWIALAVEIVIMTVLYNRHALPYILMGGALTPGVYFLLPSVLRRRFVHLMSQTADVSSLRTDVATELAGRILFENEGGFFGRAAGMLRMLFGLGQNGLEAICVLYTASPAKEVTGSFNFFLYRLLEGGLLGVLLPCVLFFLVLQNCFSLMRNARDAGSAVAPMASVSLICGVLTIGLFRYSWHDPAAFLLFFLAIALIGADARNRRGREYASSEILQNESRASIDYRAKPGHTRAQQKEGMTDES